VHRRFQQSCFMQVAIRGQVIVGTRGRAKPTGPSVSLALLSLVLKATIVACLVYQSEELRFSHPGFERDVVNDRIVPSTAPAW
jgi:hypothetical protein